jgi:hypothetical protein
MTACSSPACGMSSGNMPVVAHVAADDPLSAKPEDEARPGTFTPMRPSAAEIGPGQSARLRSSGASREAGAGARSLWMSIPFPPRATKLGPDGR